jgi:hypothetical protein
MSLLVDTIGEVELAVQACVDTDATALALLLLDIDEAFW